MIDFTMSLFCSVRKLPHSNIFSNVPNWGSSRGLVYVTLIEIILFALIHLLIFTYVQKPIQNSRYLSMTDQTRDALGNLYLLEFTLAITSCFAGVEIGDLLRAQLGIVDPLRLPKYIILDHIGVSLFIIIIHLVCRMVVLFLEFRNRSRLEYKSQVLIACRMIKTWNLKSGLVHLFCINLLFRIAMFCIDPQLWEVDQCFLKPVFFKIC